MWHWCHCIRWRHQEMQARFWCWEGLGDGDEDMTFGCAIGLSCWGCSLEWIVVYSEIAEFSCGNWHSMRFEVPCFLEALVSVSLCCKIWTHLPKLAHQNGQFDPVDTQTSRFMLEGAPFGNGGPSCQEKKQKNAALGHLPSSEFFPKIPSRRNLRTEATAATMKSLRRNSWRLGFRVSAGLVLKNAMKGSRIWPFQKLLLGVDRCGWYYSMIFPHLFVILNLFLKGGRSYLDS